jgi:hypothetical protein
MRQRKSAYNLALGRRLYPKAGHQRLFWSWMISRKRGKRLGSTLKLEPGSQGKLRSWCGVGRRLESRLVTIPSMVRADKSPLILYNGQFGWRKFLSWIWPNLIFLAYKHHQYNVKTALKVYYKYTPHTQEVYLRLFQDPNCLFRVCGQIRITPKLINC